MLVPPDTRYEVAHSEWRSNLSSSRAPGTYFPENICDYYQQESNNVHDNKFSYDPSVGSLMDVGLLRDAKFINPSSAVRGFLTSQKARQYHNVVAYVTGPERTTIAASILELNPYPVSRAYQSDHGPDSSRGNLDVLLPAFHNVSILRTETPVKQLEILNPTVRSSGGLSHSDYRSGLMVRTSSDICLHRWTYDGPDASLTEDAAKKSQLDSPSSIVLDSTIKLPLKVGVSDPVVHCTSTSAQANWIATMRGSGALTLYLYRDVKNNFQVVKCPPLREGQSYSKWHRVRDIDQHYYIVRGPRCLMTGNRKALMLFDLNSNQYVSNLLPDLNPMNTSLQDFTTCAPKSRMSPGTSDKWISSEFDYQYFVLTSEKVMWMDLRMSKRPILSAVHHMNSQDPSLQLSMSYMSKKQAHVATVYSELSQASTILEFGLENPPNAPSWYKGDKEKVKNFESLPVSLRDPQVFLTEPSKRTQTLRLFELPMAVLDTARLQNKSKNESKNESGNESKNDSKSESKNGPKSQSTKGQKGDPKNEQKNESNDEEEPVLFMGAFQYTLDHGLYSHVLGTDPTINLDLHDKKPARENVLHQVKLSRGAEDLNDSVIPPKNYNLRKAYKRLFDFRQFNNDEKSNDEIEVARVLRDTVVKQYEMKQENGGKGSNFWKTASDYEPLLGLNLATTISELNQVMERFQGMSLTFTEEHNLVLDTKNVLHSLVDSTTVESADELKKYLELLWIKPLAGFAPPTELEKAVLETLQRNGQLSNQNLKHHLVLPHPRISRSSKYRALVDLNKRRQPKINMKKLAKPSSKPGPSKNPNNPNTNISPLKWYRRRRPINIAKRSVVFKRVNHNSVFMEQRKNIVEHIAVQVYAACLLLRIEREEEVANTQESVGLDDQFLSPLKKYGRTLNVKSLSPETQQVLAAWDIDSDGTKQQDPDLSFGLFSQDMSSTPISTYSSPAPFGSYPSTPSQMSSQTGFPVIPPLLSAASGTLSAISSPRGSRRRTTMNFAQHQLQRFSNSPAPSPRAHPLSQSLSQSQIASLSPSQSQSQLESPSQSQSDMPTELPGPSTPVISGSQKRRRRSTMLPNSQANKRRKTTEGF